MTTERSHYLAAHPGSPPTGDPRAHPASSAATRSTWPLPNHLPRRRKSKPTPRLAPQSCASLDRQIPTRADDKPVVDTAGDYADPGHPAMRLRALPPSTTSLRSDTTDTGTHGHWTHTLDTGRGRRTPGGSDARTGHWTADAWMGTRGHWTLAPDPGRRTLAEDADTVTKARPASAAPEPARHRPRAGHQPCSCGQRLRRLASMTARRCTTRQREDCLSHYQAAARPPAGQAAPRRIAVLRRFRVERRARGSGSSVMASSHEGCWRKWELRTAVVGKGQDSCCLGACRCGIDKGLSMRRRCW
jgi:hypothetical protein